MSTIQIEQFHIRKYPTKILRGSVLKPKIITDRTVCGADPSGGSSTETENFTKKIVIRSIYGIFCSLSSLSAKHKRWYCFLSTARLKRNFAIFTPILKSLKYSAGKAVRELLYCSEILWIQTNLLHQSMSSE